MSVDQSIGFVRQVLKGHPDAVDFGMVLASVLHFWDDLIDQDKPISDEDVNGSMWNALVVLPANPFYQRHFDVLNPMLVNAIANWQAATQFERGEDTRQHQIAFIARSDYANILIHCAYLVGGREWMLQVTPLIRDTWTNEDFGKYQANLKRERVARAGGEDVLTAEWYGQETDEYLRHGIRVFNSAMLAPTEKQHVAVISEMIGPLPGDALPVLVDMGCGIGEVGRLLQEARPWLQVYGVTNVPRQAEIIRELGGVIPVESDYHQVPLPYGAADVVYFGESFGYGRADQLFAEAGRLLGAGGVLAIKDWFLVDGTEFDPNWQYHRHSRDTMVALATRHGFELVEEIEIQVDGTRYTQFLQDSEMMRERYGSDGGDCPGHAKPCFWRFVKGEKHGMV